MNKQKVFVIASVVHMVLWGVLLVMSAIDLLAVLCFPPTDTDMALGYALEKAFGFLLIGVAHVGLFNSLLVFFSVRRVVTSRQRRSRCTLYVSLGAMAAFYTFFILLFVVNRDWIQMCLPGVALVWLACTVGNGVLLRRRKRRCSDES